MGLIASFPHGSRGIRSRIAVLLCLFTAAASAQQEPLRQTIVVTGTYEPLPLEEVDRAVSVIRVPEFAPVANTLADLLRLDPSADLRARAPDGVQGDLSIRGGTFGQTLVLIDGVRVNDAQSGHHNLDIPVPLDAMARIELLKGVGSTLYGSDAIGGVVNIVTAEPEGRLFRVRTALGNHGVNQQRAIGTFAAGPVFQTFAASRDFSSGFAPNRDYRNLSAYSRTSVRQTDLTLAYNDRPFGADKFYGNFNSWENTKTWFASVHQEVGGGTDLSFAYRRHSDLFVLYRDRPEVFTNRHASENWQAAVRRRQNLARNVTLHYGLEGFRDAVDSTNLGQHTRARGAVYGSIDFRVLRRFSFTAGVREEVYGSLASQLSPTFSMGTWLSEKVKLRAAVGRAFRVPTYTDLYYHDPANLGSPDLLPERAWSYEGGLDLFPSSDIRAEITVFHRREENGIDYVRRSPTDVWRATNIHRLRFTGVEAALATRWGLRLSYTGLHGAQRALESVESRYVFNYPSHSAVAGWLKSARGWVARARIGALVRRGRSPYAVVDLYGARASGRLRPFLQLTNLAGTRYEEIPGVAMPGRAVVGGVEISIFGR
jgi:iron complex outermembrane receptor protein